MFRKAWNWVCVMANSYFWDLMVFFFRPMYERRRKHSKSQEEYAQDTLQFALSLEIFTSSEYCSKTGKYDITIWAKSRTGQQLGKYLFKSHFSIQNGNDVEIYSRETKNKGVTHIIKLHSKFPPEKLRIMYGNIVDGEHITLRGKLIPEVYTAFEITSDPNNPQPIGFIGTKSPQVFTERYGKP